MPAPGEPGVAPQRIAYAICAVCADRRLLLSPCAQSQFQPILDQEVAREQKCQCGTNSFRIVWQPFPALDEKIPAPDQP